MIRVQLDEYAERRSKEVSAASVRYINNPWVWAKGPNSRHMYPRQGFMRVVNRLKIPIAGFHDLRRYRATKWYEMGLEVRAISRLLGHSDIETTMRYLGIGRDLFERVREAQRRE